MSYIERWFAITMYDLPGSTCSRPSAVRWTFDARRMAHIYAISSQRGGRPSGETSELGMWDNPTIRVKIVSSAQHPAERATA
jgi:hypothetical protein